MGAGWAAPAAGGGGCRGGLRLSLGRAGERLPQAGDGGLEVKGADAGVRGEQDVSVSSARGGVGGVGGLLYERLMPGVEGIVLPFVRAPEVGERGLVAALGVLRAPLHAVDPGSLICQRVVAVPEIALEAALRGGGSRWRGGARDRGVKRGGEQLICLGQAVPFGGEGADLVPIGGEARDLLVGPTALAVPAKGLLVGRKVDAVWWLGRIHAVRSEGKNGGEREMIRAGPDR